MSFLKKTDKKIFDLISKEERRQEETLMLIPSENYASKASCEAVGSVLGNKYAEGYPYKRYYQGQKYIDAIENLVIERAKKAFKVPHANVQALSGSPANMAVYFALLKPGDTLMGLSLSHGGHLTHGASVSITGTYYRSLSYILGKDGVMDYDLIQNLALKAKPKIIIAGITAYPLQLNWKKFAAIAKKVKAYLMADIAHLAGLVIAGAYPNPAPFVDIITTTTHKTLRGPRGALIMATKKGLRKDKNLAKKIDKAVFPGLQGGPHINAIAGIGVALKEAQTQRFKKYAFQIVKNSKVLAKELKRHGFNLAAGGSNTHLILVDLRNKGLIGNLAAEALEAANIVLNRNAVPFDANPPFYPSGIRLGTPGVTSRGMREAEMIKIANWITQVVDQASEVKRKMKLSFEEEKKSDSRQKIINSCSIISNIRSKVKKLCLQFPITKEY